MELEHRNRGQGADSEGVIQAQPEDVSLVIQANKLVSGQMTTPELSCILSDAQDCYHISIIALPELDSSRKLLDLHLYLFLINKQDKFPCLTRGTPITTAWPAEPGLHVVPRQLYSDDDDEESEGASSFLLLSSSGRAMIEIW